MSEVKIPKGWKITKSKDLFTQLRGITYSKEDACSLETENTILVLRGGNVQDGKIVRNSDDVFVSKHLVKNDQKLRKGDVVIVSSTGSKNLIGKAASVKEDLEKVSFGAFLTLLRPNQKINQEFFGYFYQTDFYRKSIRDLSGGVNINNIRKEHLAEIEFPLPPLPEQQRIVAKLDKVFGHLDQVREKLDRIPELLKNFRQQVLTQAVTGELTREWRAGRDLGDWEENLISFLKERETVFFGSLKLKNDKIRKPEYLNYPITDLKKAAIKGWLKGPIGLICDSIVPGRDKPKSFSGEIPWVTMPLLKKEIINKNDAELFLTEEEIQSARAKVIPEGSVVMSIVGRFGIASILNCDAVINQQLHAFLPCPILAPKFLLYQILTSDKYLNDISTSTTVAYINKTNANSLPVNIPPIEEQKEIIKQVETLFSLADKIECQYQSVKAKIDNLPQAILAKAFRGELVGQEVKEYVREVGEVLMAAEGVENYGDE